MPNVRREMEFVEEWRKMWEPDVEAIVYNGATCDPTRVDPKVLQWVRSNCAKKPHFIKVINETAALGWVPPPGARHPERQQCKLIVPRPFARENFRELGRVVTLENGTTHKKWKVSFGAPKKQPSWLQGWKRVAIENQLTAGDVMIFVLTGDSHFVFYLFDELGLPKVHLESSAVKVEPNGNVHTHDDDSVTYSERSFDECKSKLFDPDIVKLEPGGRTADAAMVSSEEAAYAPAGANWSGSLLPAATDMGEETITTEPRSTPIHEMSREGSEAVEEERPEHGGIMASSMHHSQVPPSLDPLVPQSIGSPLPDSEHTALDMADETITTPMRREGSAIRMNEERPGHEGIMVASAHHHQVPPVHSESPPDPLSIRLSLPDPELTVTDMVEETGQRCTPVRTERLKGGLATQIKGRPGHGGIMVSNAHHRQVPPPLDPLAFFIKSRRRFPTTMEKKRARDLAKAHAELLVGCRFLVVLSESQVYRDFHLPLPDRFVSDSGLPRTRTQLTLVDWSGKEWEMYSRMNKSGVVAFHRKYWGVFALQHFLEEGDVCVFQLINKGTLIISVCIFRVVKLGRSNVSVREHYDMRTKTHP